MSYLCHIASFFCEDLSQVKVFPHLLQDVSILHWLLWFNCKLKIDVICSYFFVISEENPVNRECISLCVRWLRILLRDRIFCEELTRGTIEECNSNSMLSTILAAYKYMESEIIYIEFEQLYIITMLNIWSRYIGGYLI